MLYCTVLYCRELRSIALYYIVLTESDEPRSAMSSLRSLNSSCSTSRAFSLQNLSVCTIPHLKEGRKEGRREGGKSRKRGRKVEKEGSQGMQKKDRKEDRKG